MGKDRVDYECCRHCGSLVGPTGEHVGRCPKCGAEDWFIGDRSQVIEAEAEVIEEDIAPISGLDALIGEIAAEAESIAAEYLPHDIADEDDFKQSKRERTGARKSIAALKARYAERMGAVKDAVAEADLRMKAAIDPLDAIDKGYKLKVDEYTTRWTNQRIATLRQAYEDFAPDLALPQEGADEALVPFHRLLGRYGNERGAAWTTRTVGEVKATEAMYAAVEEIAKAERTIDSMVEEEWREGAKARYFRTLDLQATLNEEAEAKAQRERVARLEAERQARLAEEEAARRQAEEDAWLEAEAAAPVEPGTVRIVAPPSYATDAAIIDNLDGTGPLTPTQPAFEREPIAPEPTPVPPTAPPAPVPLGLETGQNTADLGHVPNVSVPPAPIPYEPPRTIAPAEVPHPWVILIPSATKTQAQAVADFMKANGIAFERIYSGNMPRAYEKWRGENV